MEITGIFKYLYEQLVATGLSQTWVEIISLVVAAVIVFGFLAVMALFLVWWERKVSGHIQQRFGPMMTGWHGWRQTIADAVKLLQKEDITPSTVDRPVFYWAPIICFVAAFVAYVTIPFGKGLIVSDLNIGILFAQFDVFVHHPLPGLTTHQVPVGSFDKRIDDQIRLAIFGKGVNLLR